LQLFLKARYVFPNQKQWLSYPWQSHHGGFPTFLCWYLICLNTNKKKKKPTKMLETWKLFTTADSLAFPQIWHEKLWEVLICCFIPPSYSS
jgi:hypothetical protein